VIKPKGGARAANRLRQIREQLEMAPWSLQSRRRLDRRLAIERGKAVSPVGVGMPGEIPSAKAMCAYMVTEELVQKYEQFTYLARAGYLRLPERATALPVVKKPEDVAKLMDVEEIGFARHLPSGSAGREALREDMVRAAREIDSEDGDGSALKPASALATAETFRLLAM